jgi:hypothetical protein
MKNAKYIFGLLITLFYSQTNAQINIDSTLLLYPENILKITFTNNDRIKAAYYYLESAKYNFKLFESEYTKFNPLIVEPTINANSNGEYASDISAGLKKEFFNGSSISTSVGTYNDWGHNIDRNNINFIETEIGFPLFSSSRALERIIKRTFEENELYTKNLEYVEAVRDNIKLSLEQYYDLVPRIKIYEMLIEYRSELKNIISNDNISLSPDDKEQIEGEITRLSSEITGWEIMLYSLQLNMQLYMNVNHINLNQLMKIEVNFNESGYFGEYYIEESSEVIFEQALNNDTEFKVLGIIKKNAEEKKRLAEKGKLDIYATTGGRYNFYEVLNGSKQDNFFIADAGIKFKINDRKVLEHTIAKAQSDISAIEYTINDRRKLIQSDILQLKDALTKKKEQMINTRASLKSWEKTYESKKQLFIAGNESVDVFIQVFRSMVQTNQTLYELENNYLDRIRDLDYVCGEYFTKINLQN